MHSRRFNGISVGKLLNERISGMLDFNKIRILAKNILKIKED